MMLGIRALPCAAVFEIVAVLAFGSFSQERMAHRTWRSISLIDIETIKVCVPNSHMHTPIVVDPAGS